MPCKRVLRLDRVLTYVVFSFTATTSVVRAQSEEVINEIVVPGRAINTLDLESISSAGSRLGLTVIETPASIELVNSSVMRARG